MPMQLGPMMRNPPSRARLAISSSTANPLRIARLPEPGREEVDSADLLGGAVIQEIENMSPGNAADHQVHRPRDVGQPGIDLELHDLAAAGVDGIHHSLEARKEQARYPPEPHLALIGGRADHGDGARGEYALELFHFLFRQSILH